MLYNLIWKYYFFTSILSYNIFKYSSKIFFIPCCFCIWAHVQYYNFRFTITSKEECIWILYADFISDKIAVHTYRF